MASISPQEVWMIPCRFGTPRQVRAHSPITVTQTVFKRWRGRLMAIVSPLAPGTPLCRSGMQPLGIRSLPIEAMQTSLAPLRGHLMANASLRWMTSYECGRPASLACLHNAVYHGLQGPSVYSRGGACPCPRTAPLLYNRNINAQLLQNAPNTPI